MQTMQTKASGSDHVARAVNRNPVLVTFGRIGWVAKGIVYAILGFLAFAVAVNGGASEDEASPSGALEKIGRSSAGSTLLVILAVGLAIYALWRLVTALLPGDDDAKAWAARAGYLVSAAMYGFLAWTAYSISQSTSSSGQAAGGGAGDDDATVSRWTADLMGHTGGRWLVGVVGVGLIVLAAVFAYRGATRDFEDDLDHAGVGPVSYRTIVRLGMVGWIARGVIVALIGVFLLRAAIDYDPDQARALDDALRRTAGSSWGAVLVALTGVGLILYAAFAIVSAPRQRLQGPRD
jgi:hypothetical protein